MNNLFTHKAMTAVINPNTVMDDSQFDYNKAFLDFFEYMAKSGCIEYDSPVYIREKINDFGKKFIEEYKDKFLANSTESLIEETLKLNKPRNWNTIDEYFFALRLKYVGNLFEAVMQCYFTLANVQDPRLQNFRDYEVVNGGQDDFNGVDAWLTESRYGIKIPVNAKHKTSDAIKSFEPFQKLQSASLDVLRNLKKKSPEAALAAIDSPSGVLFTDNIDFRKKDWKPLRKNFPNVVIITSWELYQAMGNGNVGFWADALESMKK